MNGRLMRLTFVLNLGRNCKSMGFQNGEWWGAQEMHFRCKACGVICGTSI